MLREMRGKAEITGGPIEIGAGKGLENQYSWEKEEPLESLPAFSYLYLAFL